MTACQWRVDDIVARIRAMPRRRIIVALAGPPGVGKSTMAERLADALNERDPMAAAVVPMDGFHFDDALLDRHGLLSRKGSPATFDVGGLVSLLGRLRANDEDAVAVPVFDRDLELSRAAARMITAATRVLIVEGNYLLLEDDPWSRLRPFFDLAVMLAADRATLRRRLIDRWLHYGFAPDDAVSKAEANDLPNAETVMTRSAPADLTLTFAG